MCIHGNKWIGARVRAKWEKRERESVSVPAVSLSKRQKSAAAYKYTRKIMMTKVVRTHSIARWFFRWFASFVRLSVHSFSARIHATINTHTHTPCTVTESTRSNMKSRWELTDRISEGAQTGREKVSLFERPKKKKLKWSSSAKWKCTSAFHLVDKNLGINIFQVEKLVRINS